MLQLRLSQHAVTKGRHQVQIDLTGDGAPRGATSIFPFSVTPQDEEDLRWYLEDFLQHPEVPAPAIARRIEGKIAELGAELFKAVFQANDDARDIWSRVRERLPQTRIEIITGVAEAATIPWELLREPKTDSPLALAVRSFVRAQPNTALAPQLPAKTRGKIRILLVICRPRGEKDVPFRSVASKLIKGLDASNREAYDLDVLRPPTFEQLGKVLRQAHGEGKPYHVVHFDGHGTYQEIAWLRIGQHGYLWFENPQLTSSGQFVDGATLGCLLAEAELPVLILNACRSAHADPAAEPDTGTDPSSQVRAFGSLAQEIMDSGAAGVVAMRYNVYVDTAAKLVAELYASLGQGHTLGEAVTLARKNLAANPLRELAFDPLPLQDWPVPVVYEAMPLQLFRELKQREGLEIKIATGAATPATGGLDPYLPPPPDAGFYGRDETLLAIDRAFDRNAIVLLHAYAGSGKTTTAAEFARWYSLTGGVEGPVLFTTFERYLPLPRVLDRIGQVFESALEEVGIHWLTLDDEARWEVALQVLAQGPVLWIWDNIEPVAGFPAGMQSAWRSEEQGELIAFLRALQGTKAKVLLTSRRDERAWLGDLPTRIVVPPMPMTESFQLARALAQKYRRRITDVEDWRPLLAFSQGNPLTLTVVVGEALRQKLKTKDQIEGFVSRLRSGEAAFPEETGEGRSRSLSASLSYGFEQAFNEEERKKLALLHLFQGFVEVEVLCLMGDSENPSGLLEVRDLTKEAGIALLDRAASIGLLTAYGGGAYSIHPVLPWFFRELFESGNHRGDLAAEYAFVEIIGQLGAYRMQEYEGGNRQVVSNLWAEEENLLHAQQLARKRGWWEPVTTTMQGLRTLYRHTGRRTEWKRLVEEVVPDFVDLIGDGPLPGREEEWGLITEFRVHLAREERHWAEAERLQGLRVDWDRRRAAPALTRRVQDLESRGSEWHAIQMLAVSLHELGEIHRELGRVDCILVYQEALDLAERLGERALAAVCAFNLGRAFMELPTLYDLEKADAWYQSSFNLRAEGDRLGRGKCLFQLGIVAQERFLKSRDSGRSTEEVLRYLKEAVRLYGEALKFIPTDVIDDLAAVHGQFGMLYRQSGDLGRSIKHYREALQLFEQTDDSYSAALIRFHVALALLKAGRRTDALEYAEAAFRGFKSFGESAAGDIEQTHRLIAEIRVSLAQG